MTVRPVKPIASVRRSSEAIPASVALIGLSLVSASGAVFPQNTWLQVGPVIAFAFLFPWLTRRWNLLYPAVLCITSFLVIHLFAAHWTYSDVPYDRWLGTIGLDAQAILGSKRNMFDRLVHLSFGLCAVLPVIEFEQNQAGVDRRLAYRLAILFVLASSASYEIFEWLIAVLMSPQAAEAYNGQQGDAFDSQKDMAMAALGAVIALAFIGINRRKGRP